MIFAQYQPPIFVLPPSLVQSMRLDEDEELLILAWSLLL